ncbi:hypothetical protein F3533_22995 [Vibrio parahaemolyticus]|nr:hypothetical protein [Vibrio parahaemolyticus]EGQ9142863.1 hypothetical protein [Vibrio parahaemolyticus]EGR2813157.1 hypothetical protein [Vibrio parahaemolyticus]EGR3228401.1 hypothetical protein [Vibrio parahaemolyticus]
MRCSPLNRALVANEKNAAKSECLGLMSVCFWLGFLISISSYLACENRSSVFCAARSFYFGNRFTC